MRRAVKFHRDAGFSLLEVMVAVVVLSVAVVGLFRVFDQSALALGSDEDRLLATLVARNRAEELQIGIKSLPQSVQMAQRTWNITTTTRTTAGNFEEIEILVTPEVGRAGARLVMYRDTGGRR